MQIPPIQVANFNGVGGGTVLYADIIRAFTPVTSKFAALTVWPTTGPISYGDLEPYYAEDDLRTGVSGLSGDPAYPAKEAVLPPLPLGKTGTVLAAGFNRLDGTGGRRTQPLPPSRMTAGTPV